MGRKRADFDMGFADFDPLDLGDASDVDQKFGRSQSQLQRWKQGVTTGQELRPVGIVAQQLDRLGKR